jgi:predicted nucleic acid-binding Zn ribbon protein
MDMVNGNRYCRTCNKLLRGRTDKKYCDDQCRNSFNNQLRAERNTPVRNINNWLLKNRRILEQVFIQTKEVSVISRSRLEQMGFRFKYHTHSFTNKKGNTYYYCYEYGYLLLENNCCLIVKSRELEGTAGIL